MSIRVQIKFLENNKDYLNLYTQSNENGFDAILEAIHSLISLLDISNHRFDEDVIARLSDRVLELLNTSNGTQINITGGAFSIPADNEP